jgi:hypothetical protein
MNCAGRHLRIVRPQEPQRDLLIQMLPEPIARRFRTPMKRPNAETGAGDHQESGAKRRLNAYCETTVLACCSRGN